MMKQNATLRLFIAIELPEMIRKPLSDSLKDSVIIKKKKARLTSKENLHITLKFLGDVQQDKGVIFRQRLRIQSAESVL